MIKLKNLIFEQDPKINDPVLGNPGVEVDVKSSNPEVYDVNGNLVPWEQVPSDIEKRIQITPDMRLHTKYYFATKNMTTPNTTVAVYDKVTGELRDNDTKELLITLNKDLPARQVYLWLRRNHIGKLNRNF